MKDVDLYHDNNEFVLLSRYEKLGKELMAFKKGNNGGCHCCEPVGILNLKLEQENKKLKLELDELKIKYLKLISIGDSRY